MAISTRRLRECINDLGYNLPFEEINKLYNRHSNVINALSDELLLDLLKNMTYESVEKFCSFSPRISKVCKDYDVQSWFRVEENNRTYLVKESLNDPNRKRVPHSWNDEPALITSAGIQEWFKEGKFHRDGDKPALIYPNGDQEWFKEGKRHRGKDKPAIVRSDGTKYWYKEGKLHRGSGKPAAILADGTLEWFTEGQRYR